MGNLNLKHFLYKRKMNLQQFCEENQIVSLDTFDAFIEKSDFYQDRFFREKVLDFFKPQILEETPLEVSEVEVKEEELEEVKTSKPGRKKHLKDETTEV